MMEKLPCFCGVATKVHSLYNYFLPSQQMGLSEVLLKEET